MSESIDWRFLVSPPLSGPRQLALDETILAQFVEGKSPPTLRLYTSDRAWVSIGASQPASEDINLAAIEAEGLPLVRRPTGGGAVLHGGDVSYSIVAGKEEVSKEGGVFGIYRAISSALLASLARLGIAARMADGVGYSNPALNRGACFASIAPFELLVEGRKLVGHAQRQRGKAFLIQGTILMREGQETLATLLNLPPLEVSHLVEALRSQSVCWREIASDVPSIPEIAAAAQEGFRGVLGIGLTAGETYPEEEWLAEKLLEEKYGSSSWNQRF